MVATRFDRKALSASVAVAASMLVAASPAMAASSAAATDISAPVLEARSTSISGGDEQFKQLFTSWRSLDQSGPSVSPPSRISVSIPSQMPVDDSRTTSRFGMREHPILGGRRKHKGIDLAAPTGTPVHATADGVVERADRFSTYGLYVAIDHGADIETRYAHMSRLAVAAGEHVKKGEVIGYVGSTGRSTGPHLHYEVRVDGQAVNPAPYMVETPAQRGILLAALNDTPLDDN